MRLPLPRSRGSAGGPVTPERRAARITLFSFLIFALLFGLAGLLAFLLALRGPEETQVPDVSGVELVDALLSLQERSLVPRVQVRYFADPSLKGRVVSQDPEAGTTVRAGRRITLLVSQGAVIEEVADFRGRGLQEVQAELQALGVGGEGVLFVDTVSYVFSDAAPGTIIEQAPEPGTEIAGSTGIDLVVSRGPEVERFSLPTFLGLSWDDALRVLSREAIPFVFRLEPQPTVGQPGVVVAQEPQPGTAVVPGTPVEITIRSPRVEEDEELVFGIFDRTLPEYAVAVELAAVAVGPEGESRTIFAMEHPGGRIAFPYLLEPGSSIVIYRFDTEVIREQLVDRDTDED